MIDGESDYKRNLRIEFDPVAYFKDTIKTPHIIFTEPVFIKDFIDEVFITTDEETAIWFSKNDIIKIDGAISFAPPFSEL